MENKNSKDVLVIRKVLIFLIMIVVALFLGLSISFVKYAREQKQFSQDILLADYYFVGVVVEKEIELDLTFSNYYEYKIYDIENDKVHIVNEYYTDDYGNRWKVHYSLSVGDKVIVIQTYYGLSIYDFK